MNKAQGLTIKEGVVIHLAGGKKFRPAAKHGLPFLAWTRSESFAMTAFKNLPAWRHFQEGRNSDSMLAMRKAFTADLEDKHRSTLARHSALATPEKEEHAWNLWRQKQAARSKQPRQEGERMPCPACELATKSMAGEGERRDLPHGGARG